MLRQCRVLDKLAINKEEMQNPYKHVIVGKKVSLLDFERARFTSKPHNVTQFMQYVMRNHSLFHFKGINFRKHDLILLSRSYKHREDDKHYNNIKKFISDF